MSYGFKVDTGSGGVTVIDSNSIPNWWYIGSFQLIYNPSSGTTQNFNVPNGFNQFMCLQISNGDGLTYGIPGRPPTPAVAIEFLQSQTVNVNFSVSGTILTITTAAHAPVVRVSIPATWTCKVFGTY